MINPRVTLSSREVEILTHARLGKTNAEISQIIGIAPMTVQYHITNSMKILGTADRLQTIVKALQIGLIPFEAVVSTSRCLIDAHIGARVESALVARRMSLIDLANALEIPRDMLDLMKLGSVHFSAAHMFILARELAVPMRYFYDEAGNNRGRLTRRRVSEP